VPKKVRNKKSRGDKEKGDPVVVGKISLFESQNQESKGNNPQKQKRVKKKVIKNKGNRSGTGPQALGVGGGILHYP